MVDCRVDVEVGKCRRYRCLLGFNGNDDLRTVDEALASEEISFLSLHMQDKVRANATAKHDACWARRFGHISKKTISISNTYTYTSNRSVNRGRRVPSLSTHPSPDELSLSEVSFEDLLTQLETERGQSNLGGEGEDEYNARLDLDVSAHREHQFTTSYPLSLSYRHGWLNHVVCSRHAVISASVGGARPRVTARQLTPRCNSPP